MVVGIETSVIHVGHREFRTTGLHQVIPRGNVTGPINTRIIKGEVVQTHTQDVSCVDLQSNTDRSWPKREMPGGSILPPVAAFT